MKMNEIVKDINRIAGLNEATDFSQSDIRRTNNRMSSVADKLEDLKAEMEEIKADAETYKDGEKFIIKGFNNFSKAIDQLDKALQSADKAASAGIGKIPTEPEEPVETDD